ncbi:hypothetical protein ACFL27_19810 [candidate division CSSED10-310 bacterium]|uniref:GlsB/YeaQ/YmgE family stress response membrane protein n=1 Tax=candidate division CSSED10-310 bacterium TaxID=2855610 RepID=A0ABV6Z290_UNCC1
MMRKILNITSILVFGWIGWKIGSYFGFMTGYFISGLGAMIGVYIAWKLSQKLTD